MKNQRLTLLVAAVVAVGAGGCAGGGSARNEQRGGARGTQERLTVTGCVQAGHGNTYELHRLAELPAAQQSGQAGTARQVLASGSWARLTGGKDMKEYLGQRVTVEGWIADTAQSTIGTSGVSDPGARGDTKRDGALQPTVEVPVDALANGQAPAIAVEKVKAQGACSAGQ